MPGATQALNALMVNIAREVRGIFSESKNMGLSDRGQRRIREITRMLEKEAVDAANLQSATGKNSLPKVAKVLESLRDLRSTTKTAILEAADAEWLGEWAVGRSGNLASECGISDDDALEQAQNSLYVN